MDIFFKFDNQSLITAYIKLTQQLQLWEVMISMDYEKLYKAYYLQVSSNG